MSLRSTVQLALTDTDSDDQTQQDQHCPRHLPILDTMHTVYIGCYFYAHYVVCPLCAQVRSRKLNALLVLPER